MRFLLFFILFFFSNVPTLLASDIDPIALEGTIRVWYTDYKRTAPLPTKELRRPATFVRHLHQNLLRQETEEGVECYSAAILAVIGRGAGVGGLRLPKQTLPRGTADKSYLLTPEEKAIVKSALIDAERLRRRDLDGERDYFGGEQTYLSRAGNEEGKSALRRHAEVIQNTSLQLYSLKNCIDAPERAEEETIRPYLLKALTHLDLSKRTSPKIYETRGSNGTFSRFDVFNTALHNPSAAREILEGWGPYRDIPIAYFVSQGLADYGPGMREVVLHEMRSLEEDKRRLRPKRLVEQLLTEGELRTEEDILEILGRKEISGIHSTVILESFLKKYLPESGGALMDPDSLLHLFKMAGREIDNDRQRAAICLVALERFMRAYPAYPLSQIVETLISGISYSPKDQMTDFYLEGIRIVYRAASELYQQTDKKQLFNSIRPIFQSIHQSDGYKALINAILIDLLRTDCLEEIADIGKFAGKDWVNDANKQELIQKFGILTKRIEAPDALLGLMQNEYIANACKLHIADRLAALGAFDKLSESFRNGNFLVDRRILELFRANGRLSPPLLTSAAYLIKDHETIDFLFQIVQEIAWTEQQLAKLAENIAANGFLDGSSGEDKKTEKFTPIISSITNPDLLLDLMAKEKISSQLKLLTVKRLADLGHWDRLTDSLAPNGYDKVLFKEILQLLQTRGQLTAERITFAGNVIRIKELAYDLLAKAKSIVFLPVELDEFTAVIAQNPVIDIQEAALWKAEYIAIRYGDWDQLTELLTPNGNNKTAFKRILQFLKTNGQLNVQRMIFAATVIQTKDAVDDLLTKAKAIVFPPNELDVWAAVIAHNPMIGAQEAMLWRVEYNAITSNTEEAWSEVTDLLVPHSRDGATFKRILKLLNDHKKLNAGRIIIAVQCADTQEAADDLLAKAQEAAFPPGELTQFIERMNESRHWIGDKKAQKWIEDRADRLVKLKRWDELAHLLIPNKNDGIAFKRILKRLKDSSELTAERIIFAARFLDTPEAVDDLLEKAEKIDFEPQELISFSEAILGNINIDRSKAEEWITKYQQR